MPERSRMKRWLRSGIRGGSYCTISVNVPLWVMLPAVAVTVMAPVPGGVPIYHAAKSEKLTAANSESAM